MGCKKISALFNESILWMLMQHPHHGVNEPLTPSTNHLNFNYSSSDGFVFESHFGWQQTATSHDADPLLRCEIKPIDHTRSCYFVFLLTISHDRLIEKCLNARKVDGKSWKRFFSGARHYCYSINFVKLFSSLSCFLPSYGKQLRSNKRLATS